eukprot:gnl/TRDRNA2_/TRDRNA2_118356_c0_seq1.p1 gnl/TRDRNA2_/TRDRNA2_118356_c0~~gnl/TRDRNA2_/TRDRNA2_118356_c0_seq1.p1  ORF type:complete len:141 (-),score=24.29 gnl/TRDRNA2_/TRDRNA2_118356_c0_seq1:25-393(-)
MQTAARQSVATCRRARMQLLVGRTIDDSYLPKLKEEMQLTTSTSRRTLLLGLALLKIKDAGRHQHRSRVVNYINAEGKDQRDAGEEGGPRYPWAEDKDEANQQIFVCTLHVRNLLLQRRFST